jgi:hypothetical protein
MPFSEVSGLYFSICEIQIFFEVSSIKHLQETASTIP